MRGPSYGAGKPVDIIEQPVYILPTPASSGGATNLSASYAATTVTVNSDTGTDATINAAGANAGVMSAADKTKLDAITGTNTGDQDLSSYATTAAVAGAYQPLDTQLTSLAGLAYGSNALKVVRVNAAETGFEVATPSGGSASITATTVTLPYAARSTVTVTDATVTATSKILIGWGNSLDTDANDCEMDDVTFKTKSGTGDFALTIASARNKIGGVFKINYQVAA